MRRPIHESLAGAFLTLLAIFLLNDAVAQPTPPPIVMTVGELP